MSCSRRECPVGCLLFSFVQCLYRAALPWKLSRQMVDWKISSETCLFFINCLVHILAVSHTRSKAVSWVLKVAGVQKIKLSKIFVYYLHPEEQNSLVQPVLIQWIKVIQLRSSHGGVIVTTVYLGRRVDSCLAEEDKRPSSRLNISSLRV